MRIHMATAAAALLLLSAPADASELFTGCISATGTVNKVASGDTPSTSCTARQVQFTFTKPRRPMAYRHLTYEWKVELTDEMVQVAPGVLANCDTASGAGIVRFTIEVGGVVVGMVQSESIGNDDYFHYQATEAEHGDVILAEGFISAGGQTNPPCLSAGRAIRFMLE